MEIFIFITLDMGKEYAAIMETSANQGKAVRPCTDEYIWKKNDFCCSRCLTNKHLDMDLFDFCKYDPTTHKRRENKAKQHTLYLIL